jgi:hypothetical protein
VVQEAGLGRECPLFWGNHQIEFYEVIELGSWFAYSIHAPRMEDGTRIGRVTSDVFVDIQCTYANNPAWKHKSPIVNTRGKYSSPEKKLFVDVLFCARSLKVTDQRDIIYSSLGSTLALDQNGDLMILPDYDESLDDLHIRAARALLLNSREAPQVLSRVTHESKISFNEEDYPTWVPRWTTFSSASARSIPLTWSYEHRRKPYQASSGTSFESSTDTDNILVVTGFIFDTISWTSLLLKANNLSSDVNFWEPRFKDSNISAIEVMWQGLLDHSLRTPEELISEVSLTMARGRPDFPSHLNDFLAYCEVIRSRVGSKTPSPFPPPESGPAVVSNAERVVTRCRDRRLAYTEKKRLALVPSVAEVGDVCCVVQGMDVPVTLRRTSRGTYKLVGESYIHGVMDGELMPLGDSGDFKWETIRLE